MFKKLELLEIYLMKDYDNETDVDFYIDMFKKSWLFFPEKEYHISCDTDYDRFIIYEIVNID